MIAGVFFVPWIALVLAAPPDAPSLAARLGSEQAAERDEAARSLEAMGRPALPALVDAAKGATDPMVRSQALRIWDAIQKRSMLAPTLVRLDARNVTIEAAMAALGKEAGFACSLSNQPGPEPINILEPGPIPFWEAVRRLGFSGAYFHQILPVNLDFPDLSFDVRGRVSPSAVSGPVLMQLTSLHDQRDRFLVRGPAVRLDQLNQRIPVGRDSKESASRFYANFRLMVEPRMWLAQEGPARAIEAVDDLGQSLVLPPGSKNEDDRPLYLITGGVAEGQAQLDLRMPAKPGRTITLLRVVVPVVLQIRRPLPALEIPLATAQGRTFTVDEAAFTVEKVATAPQGTNLSLDIRLNLDRVETREPRHPGVISSRVECLSNHQILLVDAQGKPLDASKGGGWGPDGHGHFDYSASRQLNKAGPDRLLYYPMVRAFADVTFEFKNIPMP